MGVKEEKPKVISDFGIEIKDVVQKAEAKKRKEQLGALFATVDRELEKLGVP